MRIISLSATLRNSKDFADWLKVSPENLFVFNEKYRPIRLEKKVLGYLEKKNYFLFDISLNYRLNEII